SEDSFQPCDLLALVQHCKNTLLTIYPEVSVDIRQKGGRARALIDSDLLELAIMNLLENAVKYSPAPAQIEIFLEMEGDSKVRIAVQDHGIGIPERDLPHIFDRFYTVDKARSRKSGGAGLGLSIVKTIIEKHRGTIDVRSEMGKGSRFTLELLRN
ncbi:MAG: sensor histidine kinase, partial [Chlamydiales bacterium]|nr:sensor histidine kinase [Chlamydiales bacterium]